MKRFEEIEHTADLAMRAYGRDLKELFANAAYGMFSMMTDLEAIVPTVRREVHLEAPDRETLLIDWLNELLYLWEVEEEVYSRFNIVSLSSTAISAEVGGGEAERVTKFIKAATFHDLEIAESGEGYVATITFGV
jgi:SHS2 domain-containing protein